jgi:CheY-like chemotaxis protein
MSAEVKERAFEPFFTTKEVGKGSGLGLSMVHGIARQSGGHATIYSELGSGTAVNIYLPRASADGTEAAAPETVPTEDMAARNGERILIVEDDGEVRALVGAMLRSLGYRTMTVEKASQAVALIDDGERFDLVLSDVVLPGGMSGPALAKEIRERGGGPKFVFMSGYPADSAQSNGLIGADEVLVNKPFRKQALAAALRRKLDEA